jgi:hypothetical protein
MRAFASCLPFLLLCGLATAGCTRKLPGPEECRAFALASVGVKPGTPASALDVVPVRAEKAEEITRLCLTTPYEYELMNCLAEGGGAALCGRAFQARHATY